MTQQGYLVVLYHGRNNRDKGVPVCACTNETDATIQMEEVYRRLRADGLATGATIWGHTLEYVKGKKGQIAGRVAIEDINIIL